MNALLLMLTLTVQAPTLDADGWTVLAPSADSRMIYVSSSTGNDANNGLTEATPKKTLAAGRSLLRQGYPDWLQLKRGDVWQDESLSLSNAPSGRSNTEKMVFTGYGEGARPLIKNGQVSWREEPPLQHIAFVGLDFYGSYRDPSSPDYGLGTTKATAFSLLVARAGISINDILFEDVRVRFYEIGMQISGTVGGRVSDLTIRRSVIADNIGMGIMVPYSDNVILEENTFLRNAWDKRSVFVHNVYMREATGFIARNNIIAYGGNAGHKLSGDAVESFTDFRLENNLFYKNSLNIDHSAGPVGDTATTVTHRNGVVAGNVFTEPGKTIPYNSATLQTFATYILNTSDMTFENNVFAHNTDFFSSGQALAFSSYKNANITARDNVVYDWQSNYFNNNGSYISGVATIQNLVQVNNFPLDVAYVDPSRSVATYNVTLGGAASYDEFLSKAALQTKANWDARYTADAVNDYMRAGFAEASPDPDPDPVPDPPPTTDFSRLEAALIAAAKMFILEMEK